MAYLRKSLALIKVVSWREIITNNFWVYLCVNTCLGVFVRMCLYGGERSTLGAFLSISLHNFLRQSLWVDLKSQIQVDWLARKPQGPSLISLSSLPRLYRHKLLPCLAIVWMLVLMFVWQILDWFNYLLCSKFSLILKLKAITETHDHLWDRFEISFEILKMKIFLIHHHKARMLNVTFLIWTYLSSLFLF